MFLKLESGVRFELTNNGVAIHFLDQVWIPALKNNCPAKKMVRQAGIDPAYSAWRADILAIESLAHGGRGQTRTVIT